MSCGRILLALITPILLSCATTTSTKAQPEEVVSIAIIEEFGFVNVAFELKEMKTLKAADGSNVYAFYFGGEFRGKTTYAALALSSEWDGNQSASPIPIFGSDIGIYAINDDSHNLLSVLRAAYGMEQLPGARLAESLAAQVISIGDKPTAINSKRTDLKAFFGPPHQEHYGELYVNIDPEKKRIEFNEKDPEYRKAIIAALTAR
jgi:hypothetical protein